MKRATSPSASETTRSWVHLRRLLAAAFLTIPLFTCPQRGDALDPQQPIDQLYHSVWGPKEGVNGGVAALAQTTDGYLWLGTRDGLVRFDGISFERFEPEHGSLPANSVSALMAVPDGGLWIGFVAGGAAFLRGNTVINYTDAQGFPVSMVRAFARDGTGVIWAAAIGGLARLDGEQWHKVHEDWNYPAKSAWALFADRDGNLWVATGSDISVLPRGGRSFQQTGIKCSVVYGIAQAVDGSIIFDDEAASRVRALRRNSAGHVTQLGDIHVQPGTPFVDSDGGLWVAANGVVRIPFLNWPDKASQKAERFTASEGLTSDTTTDVIEDHEGNIWIGTASGLDRFRHRNVTWFPLPSANFGLVEGSDGEVWAGSGGSLRYTFSRVLDGKRAGPGTSIIYTLSRGLDGSVWFSERNSLVHWEDNQFIHVTPPPSVVSMSHSTSPPNPIIASSITTDRSGAVWVAFGGKGEFRLKNGEWRFVIVLPDHPDWAADYAFTDDSDRVWLCWGDRVAQVDRGTVRVFGDREGLSVGPFHVVSGDNRGIWVGGEKGLAMFDGTSFHTVHNATNTAFRSVTGIVAPPMNGVWLSTASGIVHIPDSEVNLLRQNPEHKVTFDCFDMVSDLPDSPMWDGLWSSSALQTEHGMLWFATQHGAVRIDPSSIYRNPLPPPVNISSMSADGKTLSLDSEPNLPPVTQNLVIRYDALSLTIPERVRFRYKLDGWDHEWHDVGEQRQAFFTHLAPRKYTFHVIACNNDGVWNTIGAVLTFSVAPAWYQTYWFYAICASAGLTILWGLYMIRLRRIAKTISARFDERLAERMRIARDLHDTFLQTIQGSKMVADDALEVSDPVRTRHALQQLSGWLDRATQESRAALHSLRLSATTKNDLAEALQRACDHTVHSGSMGVAFSVVGDSREMHPIFRDEVYRIAYEAIRNAYQHSNATKLEIELRYGQDLSVCVHDNGVGIDPSIGDGRLDHFGLQGMRERAARIRGKLTIISSAASGTRVTLTVPGAVAFSDVRQGLLRSFKANLMFFFRRW